MRDPHELQYVQGSTGRPVLFLHGIGGGYEATFAANGWQEETTRAGRSYLGLDARGRGNSSAVSDPEALPIGCQAQDAIALLDHLDIDSADLVGFSMGAGIALSVMLDQPERIGRAVLLGCNGLALTAAGFTAGPVEHSRVHLDDAHRALSTTLGASSPTTQAYLDAQFDVWATADLLPLPVGSLGTPTMLITGTKDDSPPGFAALDYAALLAESLDDAGHLLVPEVDHLGSVGHSHVRHASFDHLESTEDIST